MILIAIVVISGVVLVAEKTSSSSTWLTEDVHSKIAGPNQNCRLGCRANLPKALAAARQSGIAIDVDENEQSITWSGNTGGLIKHVGSLLNRKFGILVASEFSDYQAYYLASYISEMGGECEFLLVDWVT